MTRALVFNFDGTWNGRDDQYPTNILKLHRGLTAPRQVSLYFPGPGNEDENNLFQELLGGAFGLGSWAIRDEALSALKALHRPGDRLFVTGFSRGAAVARMFCSALAEEEVNGRSLGVAFLGCFDTVGAYLPRGPSQQGLFHDLTVSPIVDRAVHAVAIDEDRKSFTPNLMNHRDIVNEVWFRGVHGDIGGGLAETGNSDTTLQWMVNEMRAAGVVADVSTSPDSTAPIGVMSGLYGREKRRVGVKMNDEWCDELEPFLFQGRAGG